jgi:hypothetical protein
MRVGEITTVSFSVALVSRGTPAVSAVADVFFIGAGRNFDIWISASVRITLCLAEELFSSLAVVMTNRRRFTWRFTSRLTSGVLSRISHFVRLV